MRGSDTINFTDEGDTDRPVVVLSNSLGTTVSMWDRQMPALLRHFRVVRYEHRGHGGSRARSGGYDMADLGGEVIRLMDALSVERAHLCGLSFGGMVAMWLAAEARERVDRLVAISSSARLDRSAFWTERAATVRRHGMSAVAQTVVARWFTPQFAAANENLVGWGRDMLLSTDPRSYARYAEVLAQLDLASSLGQIEAPTLVVAGERDDAIPPVHGKHIAAAIGGASLELYDAAHLLNVEQPSPVSEVIVRHLTGKHRA